VFLVLDERVIFQQILIHLGISGDIRDGSQATDQSRVLITKLLVKGHCVGLQCNAVQFRGTRLTLNEVRAANILSDERLKTEEGRKKQQRTSFYLVVDIIFLRGADGHSICR
jgi:hypothetical protein